jgi:hypothetical protein
MDVRLTAIEATGLVDENHELQLDQQLPISGPRRVRVIVLYEADDEPDEATWLRSAANNPVFDFLKDPEEDIYSLDDGKPFHDQV